MIEFPFFLEGYTVTDMKEEDGEIHVSLRPHGMEEYPCPSCGVLGEHVKFGATSLCIKDVNYQDKLVTLWIERQRYQCKACGKTFRPQLTGISSDYLMTQRLVDLIAREALSHTNKEVADRYGVDEKTVRLILDTVLDNCNKFYKPETPRVLGIDELCIGKRYRCVLTNVEEKTLIDILKSRNKPEVSKFLYFKLHRPDVEVVTMDMWGPYRGAVHEALPDADIVVDKFHVTRMANDALEKIRKSLHQGLSSTDRRILKGDRKILLKRKRDLSPQEELIASGWLNNFGELYTAYELKEQFFDIWDSSKDAFEAEERLCAWRASIPLSQSSYWQDLLKAETNWHTEILNYFRHGMVITNAITESLNRQIRDINRDGRGYTFDVLRGKMLFSYKHKIVRRSRSDSPFKPGVKESTWVHFETPRLRPWEPANFLDYGVDLSTV